MSTQPVTVYYDGLCPLCSREIAHYRNKAPAGRVHFLDITEPGFDAAAHGLESTAIHRRMHVKVGDDVRVGLDAFIALWAALPGYGFASRLAQLPGLYALLSVGYGGFAVIRPWLPRRKREACEDGRCAR